MSDRLQGIDTLTSRCLAFWVLVRGDKLFVAWSPTHSGQAHRST
jgi:hypothetical protein